MNASPTGIGFKYVDQLASTMGIESHSPYRLQCGVKHVLTSLMNDGHTFAYRNNLVEKASSLLNAPSEEIDDLLLQNAAPLFSEVDRKLNPGKIKATRLEVYRKNTAGNTIYCGQVGYDGPGGDYPVLPIEDLMRKK